jgi:hypothetical protein
VANRVARIQEVTNVRNLKHVPTSDNPADIISRGVTQENLVNLQLWWHGPHWFQQLTTSWPSLGKVELIENVPEERKTKSLVATTYTPTTEYVEIFSSLAKLVRVTAYMQRFCHRSLSQGQKHRPLEVFGLEDSIACVHSYDAASFLSWGDNGSQIIARGKEEYRTVQSLPILRQEWDA